MSVVGVLVPSAPFQPERVPSSVEKRNEALPPLERIMPLAPAVVTEPVGVPAMADAEPAATLTRKRFALVVELMTKFWPLLAVLIHQVPLTEMPQGLRKLEFIVTAGTEPSETRL